MDNFSIFLLILSPLIGHRHPASALAIEDPCRRTNHAAIDAISSVSHSVLLHNILSRSDTSILVSGSKHTSSIGINNIQSRREWKADRCTKQSPIALSDTAKSKKQND
eukprot:scaffold271531_cov99-Cyclotella_meneghiniana.AAC.1